MIPDSANQPYDMVELVEIIVDGGEFLEVHEMWAKNIVVGFGRLDGHAVGVVANQPADPGGHARHRGVREGGPIRPLLRRLQHPDNHLRRCPRLSPGCRSGTSRDNPSRGQALVRLLRGDRAPDHGHHPEGIRRRLPGNERPRDTRGPGLRLAVGRDRGDGCPGSGERHSSPGDQRHQGTGRRRARISSPTTRSGSTIPISQPSSASSTR